MNPSAHRLVPVDLTSSNPEATDALCRALTAGAIALVPTETVYGLAVLPSIERAVSRLFEMKGRPQERRLPVAVSSLAQVEALGARLTADARRLIWKHWPGPITLAIGLEETAGTPAWLRGRDEAAFRCPAAQFLLDAIDRLGPLFLTSANAHGEAAATTVPAALASIASVPEIAFDAGDLPGLASTVVNLNLATPLIERIGPIHPELLAANEPGPEPGTGAGEG